MLCAEAVLVNDNAVEGAVSILRCKKWDCPICQPYNRQRVIRKARDGKPNVFITLTCNPHRYDTPDQAAADMKRALVLLRRRIDRKYGVKKLPFMCVFERTKHGWPHMHILARAPWIDQKWLSDQMKELIDAPIVDIRKIQDQGRAAKYVSKYVGKDPHVFEGCKRWWRSHNFDLGEWEPGPKIAFGLKWREVDKTFDQYIADITARGYEIIEERMGFAHYRSPCYAGERRWRSRYTGAELDV